MRFNTLCDDFLYFLSLDLHVYYQPHELLKIIQKNLLPPQRVFHEPSLASFAGSKSLERAYLLKGEDEDESKEIQESLDFLKIQSCLAVFRILFMENPVNVAWGSKMITSRRLFHLKNYFTDAQENFFDSCGREKLMTDVQETHPIISKHFLARTELGEHLPEYQDLLVFDDESRAYHEIFFQKKYIEILNKFPSSEDYIPCNKIQFSNATTNKHSSLCQYLVHSYNLCVTKAESGFIPKLKKIKDRVDEKTHKK